MQLSRPLLAATLPGLLLTLAGCSSPSAWSIAGQPEASAESGGHARSSTQSTAHSGALTSEPAPQSAPRQAGETNADLDHLALGTMPREVDPPPTAYGSGQVDPLADAAYAAALARAFTADEAGGPSLSAGANMTRISFSQEGADFDPVISPDGKFVIYASTQHRPSADLYIKRLDGRTVTQITSSPADDVMPHISPDGERIAFASNRAGNWDIYTISPSGGSAIQVTSDAAHELHPSWSPDGRHLVFSRLGAVSGRWEMWVTDATNPGVAHFIGYGLFPEWCPVSGTGLGGADRIVFQRSRERGDRAFSIWTIDYADGRTSNPTEIASSPIAASINPTWSRDGRWIAYATVPTPDLWTSRDPLSPPPTADIWMVGDDGSGRVRLTSSESVDLMPSWGPDGRILFVSNRGGHDNIWQLDAGGAVLAARGAPSPTPSLLTSGDETRRGTLSEPTPQRDRDDAVTFVEENDG